MDFKCSLQQANVWALGEGTSYVTVDPAIANLSFTSRNLKSSHFRIPANFTARYAKGNIKRSISFCYGHNSPTVLKEEHDKYVCGWYTKKSPFVNADYTLQFLRKRKLQCLGNDSLAFVNGNGRNVEPTGSAQSSGQDSDEDTDKNDSTEKEEEKDNVETPNIEELRDLLQKALKELEVARINSLMFEEKAQRISENAIALKDEAENAKNNVNVALDNVQEIVNEEGMAKEAVQRATMALSLAEARLQVAMESLNIAKGGKEANEHLEDSNTKVDTNEEEEELLAAEKNIKECQDNLANCEAELRQLQNKKEELQKEVKRLNEVTEEAQTNALKAEEDVANVMLLAEQAVALELEAMQHVNDAEISLQRAEKSNSSSSVGALEIPEASVEMVIEEDGTEKESMEASTSDREREITVGGDLMVGQPLVDSQYDKISQLHEEQDQPEDLDDQKDEKIRVDSAKDAEVETEKSKIADQTKKQEVHKDLNKDSSTAPKASLKKSSRFFSASFFSFEDDGEEFKPSSVFQGLVDSAKRQWPKLVLGILLFGAGFGKVHSKSCGASMSIRLKD